MNNAAMTFDAGTWWLIGLLVTALIGAVVFLVKRALFSRVDELAKEVREIRDGTTKKGEYEKDQDRAEAGHDPGYFDEKGRHRHMTSNEKQRLKAGNFVRNNGRVLRTINILRHKYNKLSGIQNVLEDDGISQDEFLDAVNFLAHGEKIEQKAQQDRRAGPGTESNG